MRVVLAVESPNCVHVKASHVKVNAGLWLKRFAVLRAAIGHVPDALQHPIVFPSGAAACLIGGGLTSNPDLKAKIEKELGGFEGAVTAYYALIMSVFQHLGWVSGAVVRQVFVQKQIDSSSVDMATVFVYSFLEVTEPWRCALGLDSWAWWAHLQPGGLPHFWWLFLRSGEGRWRIASNSAMISLQCASEKIQ